MFSRLPLASLSLVLLILRCDGNREVTVAEIKPHFDCKSSDGQANVTRFIGTLAAQQFGIIALLQTEWKIPLPSGYSSFGAACVHKFADNAVVLFSDAQFTLLQTVGATAAGDYSAMPYVYDGAPPKSGDMCVGNPGRDGARAFTGALLRHRSGEKVCVIAGTFPHLFPLGAKFIGDIQKTCQHHSILFVVDTNAFPDFLSLQQIGNLWWNRAGWGSCSDPGPVSDPTCCLDIKKHVPYPHSKFDRTAICRGGSVKNFTVQPAFFCGADEEHRFTTATVQLSDSATRSTTIEV